MVYNLGFHSSISTDTNAKACMNPKVDTYIGFSLCYYITVVVVLNKISIFGSILPGFSLF